MNAEEQFLALRNERSADLLTSLTEKQRMLAMKRFAVVRLVVEEGFSQTQIAQEHHIPLRSLERWMHSIASTVLSAWLAPLALIEGRIAISR